jgi:hypothetical protein
MAYLLCKIANITVHYLRLKVNPIWLIIVGGVLGAFYKLAAG